MEIDDSSSKKNLTVATVDRKTTVKDSVAELKIKAATKKILIIYNYMETNLGNQLI